MSGCLQKNDCGFWLHLYLQLLLVSFESNIQITKTAKTLSAQKKGDPHIPTISSDTKLRKKRNTRTGDKRWAVGGRDRHATQKNPPWHFFAGSSRLAACVYLLRGGIRTGHRRSTRRPIRIRKDLKNFFFFLSSKRESPNIYPQLRTKEGGTEGGSHMQIWSRVSIWVPTKS